MKLSSRRTRNPSISVPMRILFFGTLIFFSVSSLTINNFPAHSLVSRIPTSNIRLHSSHDNELSDIPIEIPQFSPEEIELKKRTEILCEERNIPFENIKNARDLSSIRNSPVKPGSVIRMGKVSNATDKDIVALRNELNVKTLIDLRSPTELKEDTCINNEEVFKDFATIVWKERTDSSSIYENGWFQHHNLKSKFVIDEKRKERHIISVMNEFKYVKGTLSKLRKRDLAKAIIQSPGAIVSKRVRFKVKDVFLSEINHGGLPLMNEVILRMGAPGIKRVLELISDQSRHPIGFYCTAGKDRTGVISALILSILGVKDEDIVEDYSLSANVYAEMNDHTAMVGALTQRNLDPKTFLGAPPQVMKDTLDSITENYGSVEGYLDWIGFGEEQREKLRDALLE